MQTINKSLVAILPNRLRVVNLLFIGPFEAEVEDAAGDIGIRDGFDAMEGCVGFAEAKEAVGQKGSGGDFFKVFEGVVGVALAGKGWVKGAVD